MTYCEVLVDIAHENVSRPYTYRVPDALSSLCPGTRVKVPFGPRTLEGLVLRMTDAPGTIDPIKLRDIIAPLEDYPALLPPLVQLSQWLVDMTHCLPIEAIRLMLPAEMRGQRVREKMQTWVVAAPCDNAIAKNAPQQHACYARLKEGEMLASDARKQFGAAVNALIKSGHARLTERSVYRTPRVPYHGEPVPIPELTDDQEQVLQQILPAVVNGRGRYLLWGITGSGKTEVYLNAVKAAIAQGKGAIVLVPEIALTPQMVAWFRARFGENAAVLHSRLSAGERFDEWRRIRMGEAQVVIGARSAVFSPLINLGLIIVDEEHEMSYLSEHHPRYDAREVAEKRCELEHATLILASATPSLKSFARAMPNTRTTLGALTLLEMPHRVFGQPLPEIQLVDMRDELQRGNRSIFSRPLAQALTMCLEKGEQAMLFLNRRGHSTFVKCRACGKAVQCPQCDVSLTYHRHTETLCCHYCGHLESLPEVCPDCGSTAIRYFGAGTQKVEEALVERFPGVTFVRMDLDTTGGKDAHATLLERFRSGQAQVLIGTQMIAKGLDFPRVTLVGVVAADSTLNLPDYRSNERAFQLIVQVAGRAGRSVDKPGRVIVQTYQPEHFAIQAAQQQDYRAFFDSEFGERRRGLYPPFTRLTRLLVESPDKARAEAVATSLHEAVTAMLEEHPLLQRQVVQMRAMEAPVALIRGKARHQVFLKLYAKGPTDALLFKLDALAQNPVEGATVFLEIDPANML